jgi:GNAT superfamily N-acetyltransferase
MSINVIEVTSKKNLKKWVEFPNQLYKDNKYYVPFLSMDEIETFTKGKNPAYEYCQTKLFLAYKDNKIVGRIAGLINHAYNKKWDKNSIRFTRFDFIDDYEVSKALLDAVVSWGKELGYTSIMGPIGFHDLDHEGMLVEGFDELNMSITFYNHPYYLTHMQNLGLVKDIDWVEYQIQVPNESDPRIEKLCNRILERNNFTLVTYKKRKDLLDDANEAMKLIDTAFSHLYGTVPFTDKVIKQMIDGYIKLVNLDYLCSIKNSEGKIIGFAILVPSIAKAVKKSKGKLFPLGIFRMLKALYGKNDTLEMFLIGVEPEYQKIGIPAIMMNEMIKVCAKNNVKICETGPELETNLNVQGLWKSFECRQHKRRRCFIKEI